MVRAAPETVELALPAPLPHPEAELASRYRIEPLVREWLLELQVRGRSQRTIAWYAHKMEWYQRYGSAKTLAELTGLEFKRYLAQELERGIADNSLHGHFQESFSQQQLAAVLDATSEGWPRIAVGILLGTGMRVGELCALTNDDVEDDGDAAFLKIKRGKGAKFRRVPVSRQLRRELVRYANRQRPDCRSDRLLVLSDGTPVTVGCVSQGLSLSGDFLQLRSGFKQAQYDLACVSAVAQTQNEIERRVTATRLLAVGVFAFAWKKQAGHHHQYLNVEYDDGARRLALVFETDKAPGLAQKLQDASGAARERRGIGSQSIAAPSPPPVEDIPGKIKQLAELRDNGLLTDEEFAAKKADLLARM
ncbi:hypothetical protein EPN29_00145 [bacterium]|nr:MAG: hypothetical protein EPN29_00145 [bacterium]